jgi:type IV pilus assembly protein PilA
VFKLKRPPVLPGVLLTAGGFTLLELLVVVVITGILAAIAVPSLMSQANKAKQVEAKVTLGTLTRAQQAYFTENSKFADDIDTLGIGVAPETANYRYTISTTTDDPDSSYAVQSAIALKPALKAYTSMAGLVGAGTDTNHLQTITCEADAPNMAELPTPRYDAISGISCADGTHDVSK